MDGIDGSADQVSVPESWTAPAKNSIQRHLYLMDESFYFHINGRSVVKI